MGNLITDLHSTHPVIIHIVFLCFMSFALQVFNDQFFLVRMDDMREEAERKGGSRLFVCHRDSPGIFPAQWSFKNGVKLSPPLGSAFTIFTPILILAFKLAFRVVKSCSYK